MAVPADQPLLSVVVTVVSDTTERTDTRHLEACLAALAGQVDAPAMEIIVTCDARLSGLDTVRRKYPDATYVAPDQLRTARHGASREHHDELRGLGIRAARGRILALVEDVGRPDARWAAQIAKEHQADHPVIGGAMENGIDRPLNWAIYFCDFGRYQNPLPPGPSASVSDANVSYKRAALDRVPAAWADSYNETRVHAALQARGEQLWISPEIIVYQHRLELRLGPALLERYIWGRSYAATRMASAPFSSRLLRAALSPLLPAVLLSRYAGHVCRTGRNRRAFLRAVPLMLLLAIAWALGESAGYLTGRAQ